VGKCHPLIIEITVSVQMLKGGLIKTQPTHKVGVKRFVKRAFRSPVSNRTVTFPSLHRATGLTELPIGTVIATLQIGWSALTDLRNNGIMP
jgi:hypothetical protein